MALANPQAVSPVGMNMGRHIRMAQVAPYQGVGQGSEAKLARSIRKGIIRKRLENKNTSMALPLNKSTVRQHFSIGLVISGWLLNLVHFSSVYYIYISPHVTQRSPKSILERERERIAS